MKNMRLRKRRNWREMSLEERVAKMYYRLPKYLRELDTAKQRRTKIRSVAEQWRQGYYDEEDTTSGEKPNIMTILRQSLKGKLPKTMETKRIMFRRFRTEYPSLFAKYNSYMFRQGFKSTEYFMQNAEVSYVGSNKYKNDIIQAYLEIPVNMMGTARIRKQRIQYIGLTITISGSGSNRLEEGEINAELS